MKNNFPVIHRFYRQWFEFLNYFKLNRSNVLVENNFQFGLFQFSIFSLRYRLLTNNVQYVPNCHFQPSRYLTINNMTNMTHIDIGPNKFSANVVNLIVFGSLRNMIFILFTQVGTRRN